MSLRIFLPSGLLLAAGLITVAQPASPTQDHRIGPLLPGMAWTVKILPPGLGDSKPAKETAGPADSPREENIIGQDVRKETKFLKDGSALTRYAAGRLIVFFDPRTKQIEVDPSESGGYSGELSPRYLTELTWLNAGTYRGEEEIKEITCDVYHHSWPLPLEGLYAGLQPPEESAPSPPPAVTPLEIVAYIDKQTRLPVLLQSPTETRHYTFSTAPPVELPAEYKAAIEKVAAAIKWRQQRYNVPQ